MTSWKTTVVGILNFISITLGALTPFLAIQGAQQPIPSFRNAYISAGVSIASALVHAWISFFQTDADKLTSQNIINQTNAAADAAAAKGKK
jgi:hypothetical protein